MTDSFKELRKFVAPEFIFGTGAMRVCSDYVNNLGGNNVLLVSDEGLKKAGWTVRLEQLLKDAGIEFTSFLDVSPNPKDIEVMNGVDAYLDNHCDMIVALGGGSPIDCAKGIGVVVSNRKEISFFEGADKISEPMPPLICIPSTSGSSADVSQFAIITNTAEFSKMAIVSKGLVPDISLIDPEITLTMNPGLTAETGIDALTHAVEAYVSNASSPVTDLNALQAVKQIAGYLHKAVKQPDNIDARTNMMLGSLYAGLAFSNASLGLVHCMAHALGGVLDLPHGLCNAMLLEHVAEYNFSAAPVKYRHIAELLAGKSLTGESDASVSEILRESLSLFRTGINVEGTLKVPGADSSVIQDLVGKALNDACIVTNPRKPSEGDIVSLYGKILIG